MSKREQEWERIGAKALINLLYELLFCHKYEDPESFVRQIDAIALGIEQMFCQQVDFLRQPPAQEQPGTYKELESIDFF